jgi:Tfp pilus assembly protein PilF
VRPLFLFLSLLLLSSLAFASGEKPWTEIRSPHFRVLTNGNVEKARKVAYEFEQMRYIFFVRFPKARLESAAPLLVFAVRDEETAKTLEPRAAKLWANLSGQFIHGWEKQFTIVRLDTWGGAGSKEAVYHEYTHSIESMNQHYLPVWLNEGLAEFYAYTRFMGHKIYLGTPSERYRMLRTMPLIPLETLLTVRPNSHYYLNPRENQLFYAESWALVHFLTYSEGMENGKRFNEFATLLQSGVEQKAAFQRIFGDFNKIALALAVYVQRPSYTSEVLDESPQIDEKSFASRTLTEAESGTELAAFHIWTHDFAGAKPLLNQALQKDPKLGLAHESMGFLDFADGKDDEAEKEFSQASALDGSLYLSQFYKLMLSPQAHSDVAADREAYATGLGKIMQMSPRYAPAYVQMAKLAVRAGDFASAWAISREAETLEPSRAGYHLLTGQILRWMGNTADAGSYARFVADRWNGPDHDEAIELWNSATADQRLVGDSPTEQVPKDSQTFVGAVKSVTCEKERLDFVLNRDGKTFTFRSKGAFEGGFSDTLWYGEDHFSYCHHLEGLRAVVRYRPPADSSYAGDVVEFEVRDDLPNMASSAAAPAQP